MSVLQDLVGSKNTEEKAKQLRIEKAKNSFDYFCKTYLPHYFSSEGAEYHSILSNLIDRQFLDADSVAALKDCILPERHKYLHEIEKLDGIVDIEPREHAKTTRMGLAFPLWCSIFNKRNYILNFSASKDMACGNLSNIKTEIEENELIINDFGDLKGEIWKNDFIVLTTGVALGARGAGSSVRGARYKQYRPDMIILDDVLKDNTADSPTLRDKIYKWFKRAILPLGRDIFTVYISTIHHSDDLTCRLAEEIEAGKLASWACVWFSIYKPDGTPQWPAYWSVEQIEKKRMEIGSMAFAKEYENKTIAEEDRMIREEWIQYFDIKEIADLKGYITFGIDPATGAHDKCSIVAVFHPENSRMKYVLDSWGKKCGDADFIAQFIKMNEQWRPKLVAWEDVSFQKIYKKYVVQACLDQDVVLPKIVGMSPGGIKKETRLKKLCPLIEFGFLKFLRKCKGLIDELEMLPDGAYDDECDGLYYALEVAENKKKGKPGALPTGRRRFPGVLAGYKD